MDLIEHVTRHARLLTLVPLAVGGAVLAYSFTLTPSFTATTRILPPQQQGNFAATLNSLGALGNLAGAAAGVKNPVDQYISFLYSETVQDRIIDRFKLAERYHRELKEDLRKMLSGAVVAQSGKDGIISIAATDVDPKFAAELANAHVEQLTTLINSLAVTEAQQRRRFFQNQLESASKDLASAELALRATGIDAAAIRTNPTATMQAISVAQERIAAQEVKIATMGAVLAPNAFEYQRAQKELDAMRAKLQQLTTSSQEKEKGDFIGKYRDYKYREAMVELYTRQFEAARVDEAREGGAIQVVDVAQPPTRKSQPKKALMAVIATMAAFSGLLLYVFATFAIAQANRRDDSRRQLKRIKDNLRRLVFLAPTADITER
ncbi:Wzz/FepE/Etk N-terminal domain-containing protein [Roseateles sp.]|uniref:Wzz/FepE/Etk N-terminal domain-containing protein n=1 Tax=Roseateles sp. TaxID=1971397 RepID=UPI002E071D16|nr:Wzz/FepE/Etk N-terminal domain-containing protein [Roseateles sp.]HEV6966461.1 Wzz/FepE/Etk N-terminal domain-containing protein [Roseateles sp.]